MTHLVAAKVRIAHEVEGQGMRPDAGWGAEVELHLLREGRRPLLLLLHSVGP